VRAGERVRGCGDQLLALPCVLAPPFPNFSPLRSLPAWLAAFAMQ